MIINRILDHELELGFFKSPDKQFFTTHVQKDEINNTQNENRRNELLAIFEEVKNEIPTESAFWDFSDWDRSKWAEDDLAEEILKELNKKDKRKSNPNDALIADTAIKNNYTLITEDGPLYEVVKDIFKGSVQKLNEFLESSRQL